MRAPTLYNCLAQPQPADGGTRAQTASETILATAQSEGSAYRNTKHQRPSDCNYLLLRPLQSQQILSGAAFAIRPDEIDRVPVDGPFVVAPAAATERLNVLRQPRDPSVPNGAGNLP